MTLDQDNKFQSEFAKFGVKRLLCWCLTLGFGAQLHAQAPGEAPSDGVREQPTKDRLAPLKARLAKHYADVEHVSIETYLNEHPEAVLVDVRAEKEFAVSRIPGAVHIEDRAELLAFARRHADRQLILYCSVGARSAEAARFLQNQGRLDVLAEDQEIGPVANLAGSIFEWSNEKRPMENDAGPTTDVHPYNAFWGWRYLD